MYNIVIWGIGDGYNEFVSSHGLQMVNVVAVTDKRSDLYNYIDGIPVVAIDKICDGSIEYDYLVVCVKDNNIYNEIVTIAMKLGVKREIILPSRIFNIPFFDFNDYIKIKKSKISIVSDYCFAGFLYHKFGMEFLTPTINMFADNNNYYEFISNLKENMKYKMEKIDDIDNNLYNNIYAYPRGKVGKSEWCFNHDVTFETAAERWEKGKKRFNWDNYLVIMSIQSDEMAYKFNELNIHNKIGFYWKELGLENIVYLPGWNDPIVRHKYGYNFSIYVNRVADENNGVRAINWMKALLHENNYKRII